MIEIIEEEIKKEKIEFEYDSTEEILAISTGLYELLEIGECDGEGEIIVEGEYFLESIFRKLSIEILERWKIDFLFPTIRIWLEKHILAYILRIIKTTRERLLLEFEEKIKIIKIEHEKEMCRRRDHDRRIYCELIRKAWEAYEKSLTDIEFVKEVRFRYVKKEEREEWGEIIEEIEELRECVPCKFEPEFCVEEGRKPREGGEVSWSRDGS